MCAKSWFLLHQSMTSSCTCQASSPWSFEKQWSTLFLIHTDVTESDRQLTVWMNSDENREDGASFNLWRNCWVIPPCSLCSVAPDRSHDCTSRAFSFSPSHAWGGKKVGVKQTDRPYWITQQPLNPAALPGKASVTVSDWGGREKRTTERVHQVGIHSSSLWQKASEEVKDRANKGCVGKQYNTEVTASCSAPRVSLAESVQI